jgi:hypothetical protein
MSDQTIAAVARRLAEALAESGYERSDEARKRVRAYSTELVATWREEAMHITDEPERMF